MIAPLLTQSIYRELLEKQKRQIHLDNRAIEIGRKQREIFNELRKSNLWIIEREGIHHQMHLCAKSNLPESALCQIKDSELEIELLTEHQKEGLQAKSKWASLGLAEPLPIREMKCKTCGLGLYWEVENKLPLYTLKWEASGQGVRWGIRGQSLFDTKPWDYYLTYE
jgi:hypothetical protein